MPNENIGTVDCPITGCSETALLRKNARGWLYAVCPEHGVIQSGKAAMQEWLKNHAHSEKEPDSLPLPLPEPEPEPEPEQEPEQKEVDDLDDWLS
jgi:hypothetical protein